MSDIVDRIDSIPSCLTLFQPVCWQWERDRLESILLGLGLRLERKDEGWTRFRFPADGTRCSLLCSGGKVVRLEVFIDVNEELGNLRVYHPSRYIEVRDKVFQEFEEKFERAVGHAEAVLGPPWFRGSWRDAACPDRLVSPIRIAAWSVSGGQLMVEYQHEDNELPLIISVVVQRSPPWGWDLTRDGPAGVDGRGSTPVPAINSCG